MRHAKLVCFMCDRPAVTLDEDGWCERCIADFERTRARDHWACTALPCPTPVSCNQQKCCLKEAAQVATSK